MDILLVDKSYPKISVDLMGNLLKTNLLKQTYSFFSIVHAIIELLNFSDRHV